MKHKNNQINAKIMSTLVDQSIATPVSRFFAHVRIFRSIKGYILCVCVWVGESVFGGSFIAQYLTSPLGEVGFLFMCD